MRKQTLLTFIISLLIMHVLCGQSPYKNVLIDKQVSSWEYPPCEPSICIDPTNSSNIVAGAILNRVYTSNDTGRTWLETPLLSKLGVYGDPCIIANPKGEFYYFHLGDPSGKGWKDERLLECIVSQKSKDKGKTWSNGSAMGYSHTQWQATVLHLDSV
jgi:hypothetical protein